MKRLIVAAMVVTLGISGLYGCGSNDKGAACKDILAYALEQVDDTNIDTTVAYDEDTYGDNFERLYNFSMGKVTDGGISYASTGGYADEISIVHAKDDNDIAEIRKYMEARIQKRLQDFQGYKPQEVSKIENAKVIVQGRYVALIIADREADFEVAIKAAIAKK